MVIQLSHFENETEIYGEVRQIKRALRESFKERKHLLLIFRFIHKRTVRLCKISAENLIIRITQTTGSKLE